MYIVSYIDKKYKDNIQETFEMMTALEADLLNMIEQRSIDRVDGIAKMCAILNQHVNLILKQYYPEIVELSDKLDIKSRLKFYYDLISNLTDFVRSVEEFKKIDDNYYNVLIDFLIDKETLIAGKYRDICSQELTAFYDPQSRDNLEKVISQKLENQSREFFAMGPLESEIKKISKIRGADHVSIHGLEAIDSLELFESAQSVIKFSVPSNNEKVLTEVGEEIRDFLESKGNLAKLLPGLIITNAKLLPDE